MIKIEAEKFSAALYAELLPLAQKCWDECSIVKADTCAYHGDRNFKIEPNFEKYQELAEQSLLVLFTVRDDGKLKGFVLSVIYNSLHHKKVLCAGVDTMYIEPELRMYAPILTGKLEKELTALSVEIIGWPTTPNSQTYELLKLLGYIGDDIVMEKRLRGIEKCA